MPAYFDDRDRVIRLMVSSLDRSLAEVSRGFASRFAGCNGAALAAQLHRRPMVGGRKPGGTEIFAFFFESD